MLADDEFQSTPPRGRRQGKAHVRTMLMHVSIHASAWEATSRSLARKSSDASFQSTPPRGRRRGAVVCSPDAALCFNPRLRVGGDRRASRILPGQWCFNPRLRVGGDSRLMIVNGDTGLFQSTPPRGRRASHCSAVMLSLRFNPRLRVGGDSSPAYIPTDPPGFNPRLRVGGDVN